jgi:hypothetical protein
MDERPEAQPLDTQPDEFQRLVAPLAPPVEPEANKRWPVLLAALVVLALLIAGGAWWLLGSTVSQSDYDDLAAELDAAEGQLADADAALVEEQAVLADAESARSTAEEQLATALSASALLEDDFEALEASFQQVDDSRRAAEQEADELRSEASALEGRLAAVDPAVRLLAYIELEVEPDVFIEAQDLGVDMSIGDELLATLGENETWSEWSDSSARWMMRDRAFAETGDAELGDAYERWMEAEVGSDDGLAAWVDMSLRLVQLIVEPVVGG